MDDDINVPQPQIPRNLRQQIPSQPPVKSSNSKPKINKRKNTINNPTKLNVNTINNNNDKNKNKKRFSNKNINLNVNINTNTNKKSPEITVIND